jgi:predicted DNA-binding transcriptional regulator AlpA
MPTKEGQNYLPLPESGLVRVGDFVGHGRAIPIARSTWWAGVRSGRFPQPIKLGPRTTAWRATDIRELIARGTADRK